MEIQKSVQSMLLQLSEMYYMYLYKRCRFLYLCVVILNDQCHMYHRQAFKCAYISYKIPIFKKLPYNPYIFIQNSPYPYINPIN